MTYIPMIDPDTGEVDTLAIAERAPLRAAHEFGGPNFPPKYLREATEWLTQRANSERNCWRRDHGLPNDEGGTLMNMPAWGNSGDSFSGRV
jgi:hypothetical protein